MKTTDLKIGSVYKGIDGTTRRILRILGRGRNRSVQFRTAQIPSKWALIKQFADWAVDDITPAPTALVKPGGPR